MSLLMLLSAFPIAASEGKERLAVYDRQAQQVEYYQPSERPDLAELDRVWLEAPATAEISQSVAGRVDLSDLALRLQPAGWVIPGSGHNRESIRFVSFTKWLDIHPSHEPFSRPVVPGGKVLVPAGPAAVIWEREHSCRISVINVLPGQIHTANPGRSSSLYARIRRASPVSARAAAAWAPPTLEPLGTVPEPATLLAVGSSELHALWQELPASEANLAAQTPSEYVPAEAITGGGCTSLDFRKKPSIDIVIETLAVSEDMQLRLFAEPSGTELLEIALEEGRSEYRAENLSPGIITVTLETGFGITTSAIDVSSGEDEFLVLSPEAFRIAGTVYRDENRVASYRLLFTTTTGNELETVTSPSGEYEIYSLDSLRSVSIGEVPPFVDFFMPALDRDKTIDFQIPMHRSSVSVTDALTGDGVGAKVVTYNETPASAGQNKRVVQVIRTDDDGLADLPLLRDGTLELVVSSPGYRTSRTEPVTISTGEPRLYEVSLSPAESPARVAVQLPGGQPAIGAELAVVDRLETGRTVFYVVVDKNGEAAVPEAIRGVILARHESAGFAIAPFQGTDTVINLPVGALLELRVTSSDEQALMVRSRAHVAIRTSGRWLFGRTLAWLTKNGSASDSNGFWIGKGIPTGPISVAAFSRWSDSSRIIGTLDLESVAVNLTGNARVRIPIAEMPQ